MCCTYTDSKPTKYIPCIGYESNKRGIQNTSSFMYFWFSFDLFEI